jgi:hypothetical protein
MFDQSMNVPRKTLLVRLLVILLILYAGFTGLIWWAMRQPPETFGRVMAHMPGPAYLILPFETLWTRARAGQLNPGDLAPDFSLLKLDKSERVRLSSWTAKQPVVLVFGSYT